MSAATSTPEARPSSKRANVTRQALDLACDKVVKVLNDKAMKQCFPKYQDEFLKNLQTAFVKQFSDAIPPAWQDHTNEFDFLNKVEQFDEICALASARKKSGQPPSNTYAIAGDGSITIPSATVPILKTATEELRQKRLALAEENHKSYERISESSSTTSSSELQIQKILEDFQKVLADVQTVDEKKINELQERMVKIIGQNL